MVSFFRMFIPLMVILTIVFVALSLYSRAVRKRKLEEEWEAGDRIVDRDVFVDEGLEHYSHSLRRKLIFGVYLIPLGLIALIFYLTNYS